MHNSRVFQIYYLVQTVSCESDFDAIGKQVSAGKVVVFPTDTVFGLGSNPRKADAILRCYEIKKRAREKQVPVLFSEIESVMEYVHFNPAARILAQKFWPGKLSMVLRVRNKGLPAELVGDQATLAVRIPNHACCLRLISSCGGGLVGTSANLSGTRAFTDPDDNGLQDFAKSADFLVQGHCSVDGAPSTVVDLTDPSEVKIIREGAIPAEAVISLVGKN